jgi:branched-chain amino acid transport system ATP-binding protein
VLELRGVRAGYGPTEVLHGVSLKAEPGKISTLIGGNGAGKTTTLNCIAGVVRATAGSILWQGQELNSLKTTEIVRAGISLIPEGRHVFPDMTVAENLEMGAYTRRDKAAIKRDRDWVMHLFPKMKNRFGQLAGTLSGGEQQMLAVGRALMENPTLILLGTHRGGGSVRCYPADQQDGKNHPVGRTKCFAGAEHRASVVCAGVGGGCFVRNRGGIAAQSGS